MCGGGGLQRAYGAKQRTHNGQMRGRQGVSRIFTECTDVTRNTPNSEAIIAAEPQVTAIDIGGTHTVIPWSLSSSS